MIRVTVVVREVGRLSPDYSIDFDLPQIPAVGDYLSVQRPDTPDPYGEDLIVRQVWWRLKYPSTEGYARSGQPVPVGKVQEIFVECDQAIGPWTSDRSRDYLTAAYTGRGLQIPELEVARLSIRQDGSAVK
ncbi:hypothetical protein [Roseococcus suduntuyensis]|uniref:Uncharacterized protein n=1 Tax=Roseococcus suduntuyensis TaxID=455361 RepID=A0A840AHT4_9PROT|nr:hypothetical protein [Roseococcus suduntuyensis]MBB3900116.1 hypothetical protein [Roseococcus suduntuyensis]